MGTRFNNQSISPLISYLLLTSVTAIALSLMGGSEVAIAQTQPNPVIAPAESDDADVINPDENTEDLGIEVESPNESDLEPELLEENGIDESGVEGDRLDLDNLEETIDPELDDDAIDGDAIDGDVNDIPNVDDLDSLDSDDIPTQIIEELDDVVPSDIDPSDIDTSDINPSEIDPIDIDPSDIDTSDIQRDFEINIDGLQVDDLNEALEEDIIPPSLDILENGIELEVDPPDTVPNIPPTLPPRSPRRPSGNRPAFGGGPLFENVVLTPKAMANPTVIRGISGGPLTASQVAGRAETVTGICTGFVDRNPDHQIELTGFFDYLSLQVESPADTVLVVRGPGGSWCNDDVFGFNPGLVGEWFSGTYDIWIGSYNADTYHPYVIRFTDIQTSN